MKSLKLVVKKYLPKPLLNKLSGMMSLTAVPKDPDAVISDLFPYRIEQGWNTYFELLHVPALLDPNNCKENNSANFVFFDVQGKKIFEFDIDTKGIVRNTISIKEVLNKAGIVANGTFACFHTGSPQWVKGNSGFLAERGYTGYQNKTMSLTRGYAHGNLDAIAKSEDGNLSMLGTTHWKKRKYCLQYELSGTAVYELFFVNTSKSTRKLLIDVISVKTGQIIENEIINIPSKGVGCLERKVEMNDSIKIVINSHLNLARPVVFRSNENSFDVFHG